MKKFLFFIIVAVSFVACQKDLEPGIIYTDTPPSDFFENGNNYADNQKIWIENYSLSNARHTSGVQECCWYYNHNTGENTSYDCGFWRLIQARKFWGIRNGIIYLSQGKDWFTISPQNYLNATEKIRANGTLVAYVYKSYENPSRKLATMVGFE